MLGASKNNNNKQGKPRQFEKSLHRKCSAKTGCDIIVFKNYSRMFRIQNVHLLAIPLF